MSLQLQVPTHVDEPQKAQEYADVISRVAAEHQAVVVRRGGADVAVIVPIEYLNLLQDAVARENALEIARKLDWDRLVNDHPPPQSWYDGDEPKPF